MSDKKLLDSTAQVGLVGQTQNVDVEYHTPRASELGKELCNRLGKVVEEYFNEFPDGQVPTQEFADRYAAASVAARSLLAGSIAVYADTMKCDMRQVTGLEINALCAQVSVLLPKPANEVN